MSEQLIVERGDANEALDLAKAQEVLDTLCRAPGCDRRSDVNGAACGYCPMHYRRWKKHGDPSIVRPHLRMAVSPWERFATKYRIDESGCWLWTGAIYGHGYGNFTWSDGSSIPASRAAWILFRGAIPDGIQVCHHCDVKKCVNPAHLFLGTQFDNLQDAARKGLLGAKVPRRGENHRWAKVTEEMVREIRISNETASTLARRMNLSHSTICYIRRRDTWKHVA